MHYIFFFLFLSFSVQLFAGYKVTPPFLMENAEWADEVISGMSLEQKIGQLIMVTSYPAQGESNEKQIRKWIEEDYVGGVLFLKSSPHELASRANAYQDFAEVPLFIALDAENGLSFRLDSVVRYPYAMGLGALTDDSLIYRMGREIGQQCKILGINLNFAPVADVNTNPENPVINYRSFGEKPGRVANKSWQLARGMQHEKILVSAKHFPGHGDTAFDSHHTLPVVNRDYAQLDSSDFVPFKKSIDNGIAGIMTAHISMPGIDKTGMPGTLSGRVMTEILRDSLGFEGLVFSDGMNMMGITLHYTEGEAAVLALKAGVDVIEFVLNPRVVINAVAKAIDKGEISLDFIEEKCKRVLLAKKWLGLDNYKPIDINGLVSRLNKPEYQLTARLLYEQTVSVLKNENSLLPLARLDTLKIASLSVGQQNTTAFQQTLGKYMEIDHYSIPADADMNQIEKISGILENYNLIVAGIHGTSLLAKNRYNVKEYHKDAVSMLLGIENVIFTFFSNPYSLSFYDGIEKSKALILTYGDNYYAQVYAAQLIFGALTSNSTIPVSINSEFKEGHGIEVKKNGRLKYTIPEEAGFDSFLLKHTIDSMAHAAIGEGMFPGCQVLVAKGGKLVFHEPYGFHTYDSLRPLKLDDIYDWASLTKITGPLPLIMKMTQDGDLDLDLPFSSYWPSFAGKKEELTLREILTHQAGLKPWVPFYLEVTSNGPRYRDTVVRERPSANFKTRLSAGLFIRDDFKQIIIDQVNSSDLLRRKRYAYSDLGFLLFPDLISQLKKVDYEQYLENEFFKKLGASTVKYNPYRYFETERFVPTELDDLFRGELLQGYVHDETAAMMGGVSGNAGLFGTTNDLAKIMQLYLQKGTYGDFGFLMPETIGHFTSIQFPDNENRRGLGFDKPYIDNYKNKMKDAYPAPAVSASSFGHGGFSGTFAWADPENDLLFIFMSNRIYPTRENNLITKNSFRPRLQQAIYDLQNSFTYPKY
jgi:beta-glucosidase-like glycosyl hydrolase/CubicO group peptidase (beta-lactamase class C family)